METLGERIKNLRIERKMTQPQLAKALNVSNGIISLWENNLNEPKATYIIKLSKLFNITSDYILGINEENTTLKNNYKGL